MPSAEPNPFWTGQLQQYLSCPSGNVFHQFIGQVELTGKPQNCFSPMRIPLTTAARNVLARTLDDCSFEYTLNVNNANQTCLRQPALHPGPPTSTSCPRQCYEGGTTKKEDFVRALCELHEVSGNKSADVGDDGDIVSENRRAGAKAPEDLEKLDVVLLPIRLHFPSMVGPGESTSVQS